MNRQILEEERIDTTGQNVNLVRQAFEAFNTGNVSRVNEFISPKYFNHESQIQLDRSSVDQKSL